MSTNPKLSHINEYSHFLFLLRTTEKRTEAEERLLGQEQWGGGRCAITMVYSSCLAEIKSESGCRALLPGRGVRMNYIGCSIEGGES